MATKKVDYFGLPKLVSLILSIFCGSILGCVTRFLEGKMVAGIVRLVMIVTGVGLVILNILDFVCILLKGTMFRLLD